MSALTYHPFDGSGPFHFYSSRSFGAWDRLLEWLADDDADAADRFKLVEMFNADEDCVEVVMLDGEPIGVIDNPHLGLLDLRSYETPEGIAMRSTAGDETLNTWRTPANDIWHRIARRRA